MSHGTSQLAAGDQVAVPLIIGSKNREEKLSIQCSAFVSEQNFRLSLRAFFSPWENLVDYFDCICWIRMQMACRVMQAYTIIYDLVDGWICLPTKGQITQRRFFPFDQFHALKKVGKIFLWLLAYWGVHHKHRLTFLAHVTNGNSWNIVRRAKALINPIILG